MSSSQNSAFIDRSIVREVQVYLLTNFNPIFLILPIFEQINGQTKGFNIPRQSLTQILDHATSDTVLHDVLD